MKKTLRPAYVKFFLDSRSALQALDSHKLKSLVVQEAVEALNTLGKLTKRVTLNWIKAHNQHEGNERADQMANIAANCQEEMLTVPVSLKLFKSHIKTAFYADWIHIWNSDTNKHKHTKLFFPFIDPNRSKNILKLNRTDLKFFVELVEVAR